MKNCLGGGMVFLASCLEGCVEPSQTFSIEKFSLSEPETLPVHMQRRSDLLELSGCRVSFDLAQVPEEIGIQLAEFNVFVDEHVHSKIAKCPLQSVMKRVLEEGAAAIFLGNGSVGEKTTITLVPRSLGISKEKDEHDRPTARTEISFSCSVGNRSVGVLSSNKTSPWTDTTVVPQCVYEASADIGDQILTAISESRAMRDQLLSASRSAGIMPQLLPASQSTETMPSVKRSRITEVSDGGFSGWMTGHCGSWDDASVLLWVRSKVEQHALAKLGVSSLANYRVVLGREQTGNGKFAVSFRVFPYQGFDIEYNARNLKGRCSADLGYLGISAEDAYDRARAYIQKVLADQGVVLDGVDAAPAEFRFNGFRLQADGATIVIPFELVN